MSENSIEIISTHRPPEHAELQHKIDRFNITVTGRADYLPLTLLAKTAEQDIIGGLTGDIWAQWLHITVLWVEEAFRHTGVGTQLLRAAEAFALEQNCTHCFLETFSFQAPEFYRRAGYQEFGRLEGYPEGHTQYFFKKMLSS